MESIEVTDELRAILRVLQEACCRSQIGGGTAAATRNRGAPGRRDRETVIIFRRLVRARRLGYVEQTGKARYRGSR